MPTTPTPAAVSRGRHRSDRRFTTTQGLLLALGLSAIFWAAVAWLVVR